MSSNNYDFLRTGQGIVDVEEEDETLLTVMALMKTFSEDALRTAGRYTYGCGRNEVTGVDMRRALMYEARMFFQQDEARLVERVLESKEELKEMSEEEESGEEEEGSGEEEEESGETSREEEYKGVDEPRATEDLATCQRLVKQVDAVTEKWHLWTPDPSDRIHCLIKSAIDNVPCE